MNILLVTLVSVGLLAQANSQWLQVPLYWPWTSNVVPYSPVIYQPTMGIFEHHQSYLGDHPLLYASRESKKLENLVRKRSARSLTVDPHLEWLAEQHTRDQNAWTEAGGNYANSQCNMHSWLSRTPTGVSKCCFPRDGNKCMWDAQNDHFKAKGWTPKGNVYEVSYYHSGRATAQGAIKAWMKSSGHKVVVTGKGLWYSKKKFGCDVRGKFANCFFQE